MMRDANNTEIFERMPVPQAVRTMVVPAVVGQLIVLFYNMADTFFVARTNDHLMVAGASLILPVFNICLSISGLCGLGGGALVSRLLGRREIDEAGRSANFCMYLALCLSAAFSLVVLLLMHPLLSALGATDDTYTYARDYALCVIVLGGVPTVMSNTLAGLLRSVGESKNAGTGITMGGLLNVAIDPLFMFVILPRGYEIIGAGVATCLSNCAVCAFFIVVIRRLGRGSALALRSPFDRPTARNMAGVFKTGLPSAAATFLFDLDYMVIGRLMSSYGGAALAAVGMVLKIERLPLNTGIGICQGMMPIVSYNYAAKNRSRMNETIRFSLKLGLICAGASVAAYLIFSPWILRAFIDEPTTVSLGVDFLRLRSIATPLMFSSFFTLYLFNGFGQGREAMTLGLTRWLVFNIPMLFVMNALVGMYGIVLSQFAADVLTVAFSYLTYQRFAKRMEL